ncbi:MULTISPECIES: hypothetical protein [unclassified Providencia]|uniref:hypothetical protein n=1 Tax=unclassified Providencia TaxID=2633465 RepID=UPI00109CFFF1|nr:MULTISPECIES: hypothetical protein [unclassified Providencia]THB27334.1 hypothetical protein E6R27_08815 [Providencia sp. MGF014]
MIIITSDEEKKQEIIEELEGVSFYQKHLNPTIETASIFDILFNSNNNEPYRNHIPRLDVALGLPQIKVIKSIGFGSSLDTEIINKYSNVIYTMANLPEKIKFQHGHPKIGFAYKKHPHEDEYPDLMVDLVNYERLVCELKKNELIILLTKLGATKIELRETFDDNSKISASLGASVFQNIIKLDAEGENRESIKTNKSIKLHLKGHSFDGSIDKSSLKWISEEPIWDLILKARNDNNLTGVEFDVCFHAESNLAAELNVSAAQEKVSAKVGADQNKVVVSQYSLRVEYSAD